MSSHQSRLDKAARAAASRGPAPDPAQMPINIVAFCMYMLAIKLYPIQGLILKIITLDLDALTDWDHKVIRRWCSGFHAVVGNDGIRWEGTQGCAPDLLERMTRMKARGAPWFNEINFVIGRRAGKGYLVRILVAWAVWRLLVLGDPQAHYGIDAHKEINILIFGTKADQARRDQFADVKSLIENAPCFKAYLGKGTDAWISILTPTQLADGARPGLDKGLIVLRAAPTTATAARGAAVQVLVLDEIGQLEGAGSTADGNTVYRAATPATAQFRMDRMIVLSSSPAEKTGPQYASYQRATTVDPDTGDATFGHSFMLQTTSFDPYTDWEISESITAWPDGPSYPAFERSMVEPDDDEVQQMLTTDPDEHATEYLGQFRSSRNAYLFFEIVRDIFGHAPDRELVMETKGILSRTYMIHCDPSVSGKNFAVAVGHLEDFEDGAHVVYDYLHVWKPSDFEGGRIDYDYVEGEIYKLALAFNPIRISFDQFNSAQIIQRLQRSLDEARLPRRCVVEQQTASASLNWTMAEIFKTAAGLRRIHAPDHPLARLELEFLQVNKMKVAAPTTGHVRTDDLADAMFNVAYSLLQEGAPELFARLGGTTLRGSQPGGFNSPSTPAGPDPIAQLSDFYSSTRGHQTRNPARGINPNRRRHPGIDL